MKSSSGFIDDKQNISPAYKHSKGCLKKLIDLHIKWKVSTSHYVLDDPESFT